jgi:hypothetical protein
MGGRQSNPSNDSPVALVGVEKVVCRVILDPEQQRGVLAIPFFEISQSLLATAQLGVLEGQIEGRNVKSPSFGDSQTQPRTRTAAGLVGSRTLISGFQNLIGLC